MCLGNSEAAIGFCLSSIPPSLPLFLHPLLPSFLQIPAKFLPFVNSMYAGWQVRVARQSRTHTDKGPPFKGFEIVRSQVSAEL